MDADARPGAAGGGPSPERPFLAHEGDVPWEYDTPTEGDTAGVRWRTLVSAGTTPSAGLSLGVFEIGPGAQLAPHHHHAREVYYVTVGEAEVFIDGAWNAVRAGDIAYLPGDAVHGARNRGEATCRIVWVFPVDDYDEVEYVDD
jgi:quercetin dioxygenase-like cupin family protein